MIHLSQNCEHLTLTMCFSRSHWTWHQRTAHSSARGVLLLDVQQHTVGRWSFSCPQPPAPPIRWMFNPAKPGHLICPCLSPKPCRCMLLQVLILSAANIQPLPQRPLLFPAFYNDSSPEKSPQTIFLSCQSQSTKISISLWAAGLF